LTIKTPAKIMMEKSHTFFGKDLPKPINTTRVAIIVNCQVAAMTHPGE